MLLLISTSQDARPGEPVIPSAPTGHTECTDPACGCRTTWTGLVTGQLAATAAVTDRPDVTPGDLLALLHAAKERTGLAYVLSAEDLAEALTAEFHQVQQVCAVFPPGAVLERHGSTVRLVGHTAT